VSEEFEGRTTIEADHVIPAFFSRNHHECGHVERDTPHGRPPSAVADAAELVHRGRPAKTEG